MLGHMCIALGADIHMDRQGCFKAMLGVLALNGILASHNHEPIPPRDLSRQYFKRLASRTQGLWYVGEPCCLILDLTRSITGTPQDSPVSSPDPHLLELIKYWHPTSDYGYATTEPIQGETLATGRFSRWFSAKLMSASSKVHFLRLPICHVSLLYHTSRLRK